MSKSNGYGQFCPIAIAAEVVAERWTPLVLRGLFCGATRFNDLQGSVPRMSPALLSRRLKELEHANIVARRPAPSGRGNEYTLTEAGRALFPVLDAMGAWAQTWLRRDITRDANLDPYVLMWEVRRNALAAGVPTDRRRVARFQLSGVPADKRLYWLVFEGEDIDLCVRDPGHEIDLWINASLRGLVEVWLGHVSLAKAVEDGLVTLDGGRAEIAAFATWFTLSHFAKAGRTPPAEDALQARTG